MKSKNKDMVRNIHHQIKQQLSYMKYVYENREEFPELNTNMQFYEIRATLRTLFLCGFITERKCEKMTAMMAEMDRRVYNGDKWKKLYYKFKAYIYFM